MAERTPAIPTVWNGIKYRSRTEARWAVFFQELNITACYEEEHFKLSNGVNYLPDFYLPEFDVFLEVKPDSDDVVTEEWVKAQQLTLDLKKDRKKTGVWLSTGRPHQNAATIIPLSDSSDYFNHKANRIIAEEDIGQTLANEYGRYFLLEDRRDRGIFWLKAGNRESEEIPHVFLVGGWGEVTDHDRYPIMTDDLLRAYDRANMRWEDLLNKR
jgi:hypothetical protein